MQSGFSLHSLQFNIITLNLNCLKELNDIAIDIDKQIGENLAVSAVIRLKSSLY